MATDSRSNGSWDYWPPWGRDYTAYSSLDLPPLQDQGTSFLPQRPLPLEPNASIDSAVHPSTSQLPSSEVVPVPAGPSQSARSAGGIGGAATPQATRNGVPRPREPLAATASRDVSHGLRADRGGLSSPLNHRKRIRTEEEARKVVQLPRPQQKKRRASKASHGPKLRGLAAPPPNARVLPPIKPKKPEDTESANPPNDEPPASPASPESAASPVMEQMSEIVEQGIVWKKPSRKNAGKPRNMWTDHETRDLLKGVEIYGIGNWKKILDHPDFTFNARSSIDLKDRYRTCFPRQSYSNEKADAEASTSKGHAKPSTRSGPAAEISPAPPLPQSKPPRGNAKKVRSDCFSANGLDRLGVTTDFTKAPRRERRPFTKTEDANLLHGWRKHGFSWSKILSDPECKFAGRNGTDLRDRLRTRFSSMYEEGGYKGKARSSARPAPRRSPQKAITESTGPEQTEARESPLKASATAKQSEKKVDWHESLPSAATLASHLDDSVTDLDNATIPPVTEANSNTMDADLQPLLETLFNDESLPPHLPRLDAAFNVPNHSSSMDIRANQILPHRVHQQQPLHQAVNDSRGSMSNISMLLQPPSDDFANLPSGSSNLMEYDPIFPLSNLLPLGPVDLPPWTINRGPANDDPTGRPFYSTNASVAPPGSLSSILNGDGAQPSGTGSVFLGAHGGPTEPGGSLWEEFAARAMFDPHY